MLAPRHLTEEQLEWNRRWGAPFGYPNARRFRSVPLLPQTQRFRMAGPFAFQSNNTTRTIEYPWVFTQVPGESSKVIIDVGGGICGLQFVLAKQGHTVYCVDPGLAEGPGYGWGADRLDHEQLNAAFHTSVQPFAARLEETGFPAESIDVITCVSTIEHIPMDGAMSLMRRAYELLRPGGRFIATVDLFLNLTPFTERTENEWGTNIDVCRLIDAAPGFDLVVGDRAELLGFPEFDAARIMQNLERYYVGEYPCLAQCIVLVKH